jgi:hypothetical protein
MFDDLGVFSEIFSWSNVEQDIKLIINNQKY